MSDSETSDSDLLFFRGFLIKHLFCSQKLFFKNDFWQVTKSAFSRLLSNNLQTSSLSWTDFHSFQQLCRTCKSKPQWSREKTIKNASVQIIQTSSKMKVQLWQKRRKSTNLVLKWVQNPVLKCVSLRFTSGATNSPKYEPIKARFLLYSESPPTQSKQKQTQMEGIYSGHPQP